MTSILNAVGRLFVGCLRPASESEALLVKTSENARNVSGRQAPVKSGVLNRLFTRIRKFFSHGTKTNNTVVPQAARQKTSDLLHTQIFERTCREGFVTSGGKILEALKDLDAREFGRQYREFLNGSNAMRSAGCLISNIQALGFKKQAEALRHLDIGYGFSFGKSNDEGLIAKIESEERVAQHVLEVTRFLAKQCKEAFSGDEGLTVDVGSFADKLLSDLKDRLSSAGDLQSSESQVKVDIRESTDSSSSMLSLEMTGNGAAVRRGGVEAEEVRGEALAVEGGSEPPVDLRALLGKANFTLPDGNLSVSNFSAIMSELQREEGPFSKFFSYFEGLAISGDEQEKKIALELLSGKAPQQYFTNQALFGKTKEAPMVLKNQVAKSMLEQLNKNCANAVTALETYWQMPQHGSGQP